MEPIKVIIFVAFFGLFLIVVRAMFSHERLDEMHAVPPPYPDEPEEDEKEPALVGSDLPFPILLPPRVRMADGTFNRPELRNYFFRKTDLVRGPEDPESFFDELTIQFESPEDRSKWFSIYMVATPQGMQKLLDTTKSEGIMLEHEVIIVSKWDVAAVLKIIMNRIMENWAVTENECKAVFDPSELPDRG